MNTVVMRDQRLALGRTQSEIAKLLGIAPNTYSQYESGKREPDHSTLVRLSQILDLPIHQLLLEDKDIPRYEGFLGEGEKESVMEADMASSVSNEDRLLRLAEQLAAALAAQNGALSRFADSQTIQNGALDKLADSQLLAQQNIARALDKSGIPHPADRDSGTVPATAAVD